MHSWFGDKVFMSASAFSVMAFLDRWARGMGGQWLTYVERFIERKKAQGISVFEVFDETTFWHDRDDNPDNDHRFYNLDRATSVLMWSYGGIARSGPNDIKPKRLTPHHQVCLLKLIELAQKHDIKVNLCVDATLKHSPGVGWLVIGHCIRQVANFMKHVEKGQWVPPEADDGAMGSRTDQAATERIRVMFDAVKGPGLSKRFAVRTHNECDAHSQGSWRDSWPEAGVAELRDKAFAEVNLQLDRMRRPEYWSEAAVMVDQGGGDGHGSDLFEYDHKRADAIAFHPSRPDMSVGSRFDHIVRAAKKLGIAAYATESIHGIGDAWWWTIEQGWFRPRSSTKDHEARRRFLGDMMALGINSCDHSLENTACGMWVDGGVWTEMPLTEFEQILVSEQGGVDPPPPSRMRRFERVIRPAYQELLDRQPDEGGLNGYNEAMLRGLTEAEMREALLRSQEYADKNPEVK